jgi:hypothetical protein
LAGKHFVYVCADGVHFHVRLEQDRQCILVLMGATPAGHKELIALADGFRESEQSWKALLLDCQARGMSLAPSLTVADGALGFCKALRQVFPTTREQRCWVHKTANVLDKLLKSQQPKAKAMLQDIWQADTNAAAEKAFETHSTKTSTITVHEHVARGRIVGESSRGRARPSLRRTEERTASAGYLCSGRCSVRAGYAGKQIYVRKSSDYRLSCNIYGPT